MLFPDFSGFGIKRKMWQICYKKQVIAEYSRGYKNDK